MIELRRILLVDWYLFRVEQIDLAGMAALIGPNGAGKSAIIDAAQTVLTGANMMSIRFNPSAQSVARSKRSIRDYCLGVVSLDEKGERSEPTRQNAYTYAILGFVDVENGDAVNLGVAFSASAARGEERCEARFMVKGGLVSQEDVLEDVGNGDVETRHWHAVQMLLRARGLDVVDDFGSAGDFVAEGLRALSPPGFPLDPRRFIKAFRNALLLKPVDNPTEFVRNYVLDVPTIHVDALRRSIELYRFLAGKIENLKAQTASLRKFSVSWDAFPKTSGSFACWNGRSRGCIGNSFGARCASFRTISAVSAKTPRRKRPPPSWRRHAYLGSKSNSPKSNSN